MDLVSHEEWSEETRRLVTSVFESYRCDCPEGRNPIDSRTRRGWILCIVVCVGNGSLHDDRMFYDNLQESLPMDTKVFICCDRRVVNEVRYFALLGFSYQFKSWAGMKEGLVEMFSDGEEDMVIERFYVCKQGEFVDEWIDQFYLFGDVVLTRSDKLGVPFRGKDLRPELVDEKLRSVGVLPTAGDMWMLEQV